MDLKTLVETLIAIATPLLALISVGARRRHLRTEVRDNLALIEEIKKDQVISQYSPAIGMLSGKVVLDVAKLAGQSLGGRKKPIPWGSAIVASLLTLGFAYLTYAINRDGFEWYSVFPGSFAFLLFISVLGMTTNRQILATPNLPEGAVPIRSETAAERVASSVQLAASGADVTMLADGGQAGVALRFIELQRQGKYEEALELVDENWVLCRIQSRLWNMHLDGELEADALSDLAQNLHTRKEPKPFWESFVAAEAEQFTRAWEPLDPDSLGIAGNRRRVSRDYDVVLLVPMESEGYFVTSATAIPGAMPFLMHDVEGRWLVANHIGSAPPVPGFPPTWWTLLDPAFADLPER